MTQKSTCKYLPYLFSIHCRLAEILNLITDKREWLKHKMYDKRLTYQAYGVIFLYNATLDRTIKSCPRISIYFSSHFPKSPTLLKLRQTVHLQSLNLIDIRELLHSCDVPLKFFVMHLHKNVYTMCPKIIVRHTNQ